jgi:hypothetical protein
METINTLIHVLATHVSEEGRISAKVTIRLGNPKPGDRVWYEGTDSKRRVLTVESVERATRMSKVVFAGDAEDIGELVRGTYLYATGSEAD